MKNLTRVFAVLLAVALCIGMVPAMAEETDGTQVLATVNGEDVTYDDMQSVYTRLESYYSNYGYDTTDASVAASLQEAALEYAVQDKVMFQKAAELGLDKFTDEEIEGFTTEAQSELSNAIDLYAQYYFGMSDSSTDEEKATCRASASDLLLSMGYTVESLADSIRKSAIYDKVDAYCAGDVTISDEEVQAHFEELAAQDQTNYESDVSYYEYMVMYYGYSSYYTPEGYRNVKHLLISADEDTLNTYTSLQATYEEQHAEGYTAAEGVEIVTEEQIEEARLAVVASVQSTLDEIKTKMDNGATFEEMIDEYTVDSSDSTTLFKVNNASILYDPAFTAGAMGIAEIGGISDPVVSQFGVHLIKYDSDIASGTCELTDEIKETLRSEMVSDAVSAAFNTVMDEWMAASTIEYTQTAETAEPTAEPTAAPAA